MPLDLQNVLSLTVGVAHACATKKSGEITCWGNDRDLEVSSIPKNLIDAPKIKIGWFHTCALFKTNDMHCYSDEKFK